MKLKDLQEGQRIFGYPAIKVDRVIKYRDTVTYIDLLLPIFVGDIKRKRIRIDFFHPFWNLELPK